tara:strand:- start:964 stop:1455 length:492 start_codon:yes stop_codon:yes gene_type:complete
MKNFKIFENDKTGAIVSIKDGWSWPAFFFNFIWCFVKKLHMIGIGLVIFTIVSEVIIAENTTYYYDDYYHDYYYEDSNLAILFALINIAIAIWLGVTGNEKRCDYYESVGFIYQGMVTAVSPDAAIATYARGTGNQGANLYSNDNIKHRQRKGGSYSGNLYDE